MVEQLLGLGVASGYFSEIWEDALRVCRVVCPTAKELDNMGDMIAGDISNTGNFLRVRTSLSWEMVLEPGAIEVVIATLSAGFSSSSKKA